MRITDKEILTEIKLRFEYDDEIIDFSEIEEFDTDCKLVPCGFERGFMKYKATNDRSISLVGIMSSELTIGQQGDFYIYHTTDSGSIWQMVYNGCKKMVHSFTGTAA